MVFAPDRELPTRPVLGSVPAVYHAAALLCLVPVPTVFRPTVGPVVPIPLYLPSHTVSPIPFTFASSLSHSIYLREHFLPFYLPSQAVCPILFTFANSFSQTGSPIVFTMDVTG